MDHRGTLLVRTALQRLPQRVLRAGAEPLAPCQELIIEVTDTGPGIPPDRKEKIFEPFYSTKKGGTGLGLATVERLISKHNGRIEVESQPGHGTTMRLHLPLLPAGPSDAGQE
jgi:signal transduction histidine kinase